MPVCKGCGGSYDDGFKFCPYCGRAKPEPEAIKVQVSVSSSDKWETCKIYQRSLFIGNQVTFTPKVSTFTLSEFWAEAIGPEGKYLAGKSPPFYYNEDVNTAHTFFVNQLTKCGWEATGYSEVWWEVLFRRQVSGNYPKPFEVWAIRQNLNPFGRGYFDIFRLPNGDSKILVAHGKSAEIRGNALLGPYAIKNEANLRILESFLQELKGEGFEQVNSVTNENIKRCIAKDVSRLWFYHIFLWREQ